MITSVSSESEGEGDESFEEVGVPSRVAGVPQGLAGELSRSTRGPAVLTDGGPRGGQDIGLKEFFCSFIKQKDTLILSN